MSGNVAFLIFDDVEVLDVSGSSKFFEATGGHEQGERPFHVYTVAEKAGAVHAHYGLSVNPDYTFAQCLPPDILLVPGGRGTRREKIPILALRYTALLERYRDLSGEGQW